MAQMKMAGKMLHWLVDLHQKADAQIRLIADALFPIGSWVQVRGVVGKVHCLAANPCLIALLLEHKDVLYFPINDCEPCEAPAWAANRGS